MEMGQLQASMLECFNWEQFWNDAVTDFGVDNPK
jgi:hypothetical protein